MKLTWLLYVSVSTDFEPLSQIKQPCVDPLPGDLIISLEAVEKLLESIKTKKAIGPDNITIWVLKELPYIIAKPICAIFNSSLREVTVPLCWEKADIIPVPKVTPDKLLEKYPVQHLRKSCPDEDPNQFGVSRSSSTTHTLLKTSDS
jgi:hypothetical protein